MSLVEDVDFCFECLESTPLCHGIWPFRTDGLFLWARTRHVKPPYQPRHDQVPRFDEWRCNDRKCSSEKPDKDEAGAMT